MITPPYLISGDTIGIVSPGAQITKDKIENAVRILEGSGFKVVLGNNLLNKSGYFAGTDKERTSDFQKMLDNENIKAILCARGGYGTIRVIKKLNFKNLIKSPKWIIGFSDITVLHNHINNSLGTESIHATMPIDFPKVETNSSVRSLLGAIQGLIPRYELEPHELNNIGLSKGVLTGGNLSVLYSLRGTKYDINPKGKILFLEDIGENLYHLDRMMMNLKIGGIFDKINGLIIGDFSEMKNSVISFAKSAYDVIENSISEYDFPVIFDFPSGHAKNNLAVYLGKIVEIRVTEKNVALNY